MANYVIYHYNTLQNISCHADFADLPVFDFLRF